MPDLGIYCLNASIVARAGSGVNATAILTTSTDKFVLDVENTINVMTRKVWAVDVAAFAALSAGVRAILTDAAASLCTIYTVMWDMSGYSSRGEAQTIIDVCRDSFVRDVEILKDLKNQTFVDAGV